MKIKRLYINNYKSLVDFELIDPNPFSVFVGPNAAGKSNVFEALEFLSYAKDFSFANNLFGGANNYLNKNTQTNLFSQEENEQLNLIQLHVDEFKFNAGAKFIIKNNSLFPGLKNAGIGGINTDKDFVDWYKEIQIIYGWYEKIFSRIFINNKELVKIKTNGSDKLRVDGDNLASVLKRIIDEPLKKEEINEWLQLLIPEFEDLQINRDNISGSDTLLVKEKYTKEYFKKDLLSDGTYNILALLTAVYQSDEPQFICIEEPENGLTPFVIYEMIDLFRQLCEEEGHYIWLNTHSPYLVRQLLPKEIILIDKKEGITRAKQVDKDLKFKTMKMDEAWLSNALGGGLPW